MKLLFIGFGNVARKAVEILTVERDRFPGVKDLNFRAVGIFTRSRGSLACGEGLDMTATLDEFKAEGHFPAENLHYTDMSSLEACRTLDYDVLVELTTLSIEGRGEPALSHVKAALDRGKHVVTANKGPVSFAFQELSNLAESKGCRFLYESSVMDGAPIFNLARSSLRGARVCGFSGILNGTTNYVLARMEQGEPLEVGVRGAIEAGIAEADPSHDIEGWDAAAKTAALANVLMGAKMTPFDVERQGISLVTPEEATAALERGERLKLVCRGWEEDGGVRTRVGVESIVRDDPFALVSHFGAALRLETDLMHPLIITQEAPDLYDTAYGVINDLMELADQKGWGKCK